MGDKAYGDKAYVKIFDCKKKVSLCVGLSVIWIDLNGFVVDNQYFHYDEYCHPDMEFPYDYDYQMKLSFVNEQMVQLTITWRFCDEKYIDKEEKTIHTIDLTKKTIYRDMKDVKLDGVINDAICDINE